MDKIDSPEFIQYQYLHKVEKTNKISVAKQTQIRRNIYPELENIFEILNFNYTKGINSENLLLSPFFLFFSWRRKIKDYISSEVNSNVYFESAINKVVSSLKELEYRLGHNFTWDLISSIENSWYQSRNKSIYEELDERGEYIYPLQIRFVKDEVEWLQTLKPKDLKLQYIEISSKYSLKQIKTLFVKLLKEKRYFNKIYNSKINIENEKFLDVMFLNADNSLNLSFVPKDQILNIVKVFFYLRYKGVVASNKEVIKSKISEVFDCGKRTFETLNDKIIKSDLDADMGIAYYVNNQFPQS
ncbi:MAG: hypothetical protein ACK5NB_10320 [Flavobacteriaceae bacterium]